MTFAFAYWLYVKHLSLIYGKTRQAAAFFGALTLAVLVDSSGWMELVVLLVASLGRVLWARLLQ